MAKFALASCLYLFFGLSQAIANTDIKFEISAAPNLISAPYTGRVYVILGQLGKKTPLQQSGYIKHAPLFAHDVTEWDGNGTISFAKGSISYPVKLEDVTAGGYQAQAIIRLNQFSGRAGRGSGDIVSIPTTVTVLEDKETIIKLSLTEVVTKAPTTLPDNYRYMDFESESLTQFHQMPYTVPVMVRLPADWKDNDTRKWPVLFYVTGFGGTSSEFLKIEKRMPHIAQALDQVIVVAPSAQSYRGHTVFADSANNGPWGHMLVEELAPFIDNKFGGKGATSRYVTGISSGGWSSLWLQVTYPAQFAGAWSHVPDSVDFRDFQTMDLYSEGTNMYRDEKGNRRPVSRPLGKEGHVIYVDNFVAREIAWGPGGQYQALEAVFSPRGDNGEPVPFFDRKTGFVNHKVIEYWKPYDIRLKLKTNWEQLRPHLQGKLFIYAGEKDSFHLEGATRLLKAELASLGSDAHVEIIPGMGHAFAPSVWENMLEKITGVMADIPQPSNQASR